MGQSFDATYSPDLGHAGLDYGKSKAMDKILGPAKELGMRGRGDFGFPLLDECKLVERKLKEALRDTEERLQQIEQEKKKDKEPELQPPAPKTPALPPAIPLVLASLSKEDGRGPKDAINFGEGETYVGSDTPSSGNLA